MGKRRLHFQEYFQNFLSAVGDTQLVSLEDLGWVLCHDLNVKPCKNKYNSLFPKEMKNPSDSERSKTGFSMLKIPKIRGI
ncbi:hypothetical protein C943_03713 [Mariniradius saccharolyticus AK6]|uniref:Uncharacterized protein n=1 Tax=Mariniradius saccharolyticus AK6 TaxID=1239962 RepID=M7XI40_9BACT|nr:hypothetical protein C943_03713 [Mariniradius saccharolyticus AK6]